MGTAESYDIRSVDRGEVLRYLGYAGQELSPELDGRIDAVIDRCLAAARPAGCARVFDVSGVAERDGVPVIGLAGTALQLTDRVGQLVFDAAGSALVERAADAAEARVVAAAAERGLFCGTRFSPGYGDFPLATQPILLATLDAQRALGITLSPELLMTPTKSVTAVVGLFGKLQEGTGREACGTCLCRDFCLLRASGRTCGAARCA